MGLKHNSKDSKLRRFRQYDEGFDEEGDACVLLEVKRINALKYAEGADVLLVSTETGLIKLNLNDRETEVVTTFDSRVVFPQPRLVAKLPPMNPYVLGDFDADGRYDIAGINEEKGRIEAWFNDMKDDGTGGFLKTIPDQPVVLEFGRVLVSDINRDGYSDLLLIPKEPGKPGAVLKSLGRSQKFDFDQVSYLIATPSDATGAPAVADFNGDGYDDLFWPTKNTGAVSFGDTTQFHAPLDLGSVPVDANGNKFEMDGRFVLTDKFEGGRPDLIASGSVGDGARKKYRLSYYRNKLGYNEEIASFDSDFLDGEFDRVGDVVTGEFTPGKQGIAAFTYTEGSGFNNGLWSLHVWPTPSSKPVEAWTAQRTGDVPHSLNAFDIDRDGDSDFAFIEVRGAQFIVGLINGGSGKSFSRDSISSESLAEIGIGGPIGSVRFVDLDGDGFPDPLAQAEGGDVHHSTPE